MSPFRPLLLLPWLFALPAFAAPPTLKATACAGRHEDCRVSRVLAAGKADDGTPLSIAEIALGLDDKADDAPEEGCRNEDGSLDGGREWWLLAGSRAPQHLFSLCNDGYGASGVGADEIVAGANRLTHRQLGGSAWRWETERSVSLQPLRPVHSSSCSFNTVQEGSGTRQWIDHAKLRIRRLAMVPASEQQAGELGLGCPDENTGWQAQPAPGLVAALQLPRIDPATGDAVPARGQTLGSCALALNGNGEPGFRVYGEADSERDSEVRLLLAGDRTLLVQVRDSHPDATPADSWVQRDHLEFWLGLGTAPDANSRLSSKQLAQLGVTLDGQVWRGYGKAPLPKVERWTAHDENGRALTVLRLDWKQAIADAGLVAVWSQAVNGRQQRLVATTAIVGNRPLALPPAQAIPGLRCRLHDGRLDAGSDGGDPFAE